MFITKQPNKAPVTKKVCILKTPSLTSRGVKATKLNRSTFHFANCTVSFKKCTFLFKIQKSSKFFHENSTYAQKQKMFVTTEPCSS